MKKYNALLINGLLDKTNHQNAVGEQIHFNGELFYKISNVANMRPFFMSIVSPDNHWLFISSNGGITAGRKNSNFSLFPYYTDDKITESFDTTGNKTILRIKLNNKNCFSVQFHPESSPGPHDSQYLFDQFINNIKK